jgi:hypothetical protein
MKLKNGLGSVPKRFHLSGYVKASGFVEMMKEFDLSRDLNGSYEKAMSLNEKIFLEK